MNEPDKTNAPEIQEGIQEYPKFIETKDGGYWFDPRPANPAIGFAVRILKTQKEDAASEQTESRRE